MKENPEISIVLPVFNEEQNISRVVNEFAKLSKKNNIEVIFVEDGGSKDKTREVLKQQAKKYKFVKALFIEERGYGISLYSGLQTAKGEFIGWTHSDLQTSPKDVIKALNIIRNQENSKKVFVKGKRYGRPLMDKLVNSFGMSIFETLVLGKFMYDINAQPNIFPRGFLKLLTNPPSDFAFDLYVYYIAKMNNYKIIRFPVFFGKRIFGESAWNTGWKARIKFIKRTIKFTFELKRKLKNDNKT